MPTPSNQAIMEEEEDVEEWDPTAQRPFPTQQIFILALCRITEPVAFCSIFPYVYYMVLSFEVTDDERRIAVYCGAITSIFAFSEFATGMIWGALSDKYGRKPVLMMGLFGTGLSMVMFGFAKSLPVALFARAIGGGLNGNVGVLQTAVAELVTKEQQAFAFSIMPFIWCIGAIFGSCLGGLAQPVENYPDHFARGTIWDKYPFLLPNLVAAVVVCCGILIGLFFLEETNEKIRENRDYTLELQRWTTGKIYGWFTRLSNRNRSASADHDETSPLLHAHERPENTYDRRASQDIGKTIPEEVLVAIESDSGLRTATKKAHATFNSQVVIQIVAYGILAYHTISFDQLLPVYLSMDEPTSAPKNFLKFTGGFALPVSTIGAILGGQGIYQMVFQILFFAPIIHRAGALWTFRFCAITYPLLYIVVPYLILLPSGTPRMIGLAAVLIVKVAWSSLAYPANMLLLTSATPSLLVLGTVNGVAASCACLCRSFGPTLSGVIQAIGLDTGYGGLPWWSSALVCVIGGIQCLWMRDVDYSSTTWPITDAEEESRESEMFRRGSVSRINVSSNTESSITESQFLAQAARGGSVVRRMSVSTHRGSIAGFSIRAPSVSGDSPQLHARRERSVSTLRANPLRRERSVSTIGANTLRRERSVSTVGGPGRT